MYTIFFLKIMKWQEFHKISAWNWITKWRGSWILKLRNVGVPCINFWQYLTLFKVRLPSWFLSVHIFFCYLFQNKDLEPYPPGYDRNKRKRLRRAENDNQDQTRCKIFGFFLLWFPQNERKIYQFSSDSLAQFVYFLSEVC